MYRFFSSSIFVLGFMTSSGDKDQPNYAAFVVKIGVVSDGYDSISKATPTLVLAFCAHALLNPDYGKMIFMKKRFEIFVKYSLVFLLGAVVSAYLAVRFHSIRTIEKIQIASSAMETYKAVATLELLRREKKDAAMDFLEWQADEGLMGLSFYTSDPNRSRKLDAFALEAISKAREYREIYPRKTKNNNTDDTVLSATSFGHPMTNSMKNSSSLLRSNFPPAETD